MGKMRCETTMLLVLVFFFLVPMVMGFRGEGEKSGKLFLLKRSKEVVKSEGGEVRVMRGGNLKNPIMHIGFITMEPNTLFIPQYLDSSFVLFIRSGAAKIGWISKNKLREKKLNMGDLFRIQAGSAFYMVNTGEQQKLRIICSIDTSESLGKGPYQSFFIGGGMNPTSVLSGFDNQTLEAAFNVSSSQLDEIMTGQQHGPIMYITDMDQEGKWASLMQLKQQERVAQLQNQDDQDDEVDQEEEQEEEEITKWTWRKLLNGMFGNEDNSGRSTVRSTHNPYNLYDKKQDFQNDYGWSVAVDEHDYKPLKHSDIGVYLVNLSEGSMMAPHMNPMATEYGIILKGSGSIQIVFPNGTLAMNADVEEGDVFWVPRYFPLCQIASTSGPMEFFGFTTSARKNRPQFLAGSTSILHTMNGPEIATAFGVIEEKFTKFIKAQRESIILPARYVAPLMSEQKKLIKPSPPLIHSFAADMIMGFD